MVRRIATKVTTREVGEAVAVVRHHPLRRLAWFRQLDWAEVGEAVAVVRHHPLQY